MEIASEVAAEQRSKWRGCFFWTVFDQLMLWTDSCQKEFASSETVGYLKDGHPLFAITSRVVTISRIIKACNVLFELLYNGMFGTQASEVLH